ncbi:MAG: amidohydrolase family protein [Oscillospiraceae bacterium]
MHSYTEYEIFDAHTHIFPEKIADKAAVAIGDFYGIPMKYSGHSRKLIKSGSKIGVRKYLVCSTATVPEQTEKINDFIIEECRLHSEFIGFGTLHPDTENMDTEIEKMLKNGLRGVKLHPDFQKFNIDDEKAMNIYKKLAGVLPVLIHMGDDRYDYSSPERLYRVKQKLPELEVFAAHFGGYQRWEEAAQYLLSLDNIHFDTSSTLGMISVEYAQKIVSRFDTDKLLFGTDFPMWDHEEELKRFFRLELSDEVNKKILSENFKRIFNI